MARIQRSEPHAKRSVLCASEPLPEAARPEATPPSGAQLDRIGEILLGGLPSRRADALHRLEARADALARDLQDALEAAEQRLAQRIAGLQSETQRGQSELRELLHDSARQQGDAIQDWSVRAHETLETGLEELRGHKLERESFARLLARLGTEFDSKPAPAATQEQP